MAVDEFTPRRAWLMLGLGVASQTAGSMFAATPAFLIPALHAHHHSSLASAGLLAAMPTVGMVLTLLAWGAAADRYGEKWIIVAGLALTCCASAIGAIVARNLTALAACLLVGGVGAASTSSASGRVVIGWFPKHKRGLAMGIRQMSYPLGVTMAALIVPALAARNHVDVALLVCGLVNGAICVACAIGIVNPKREKVLSEIRATNPYRRSSFLWRIHLVSILLVVPQFTVSMFGLVWLITDLHWNSFLAGLIVGAAQFAGAIGRIGIGLVSDKVGSRTVPLRWVAISACAVMLLLALSGTIHWNIAGLVLIVATMVTVADNGLGFTAVAEAAGTSWSGRALGVQNTGQFIAASIVGPAIGFLIGTLGYPAAFAVTALCPALATSLIPSRDEIDAV